LHRSCFYQWAVLAQAVGIEDGSAHVRHPPTMLAVHVDRVEAILAFLCVTGALIKQEQEVEVWEDDLQGVNQVFDLDLHMTVRPVAIMGLAVAEHLQKR
jgi:hypothetical protein